jgi:hypothetical protein
MCCGSPGRLQGPGDGALLVRRSSNKSRAIGSSLLGIEPGRRGWRARGSCEAPAEPPAGRTLRLVELPFAWPCGGQHWRAPGRQSSIAALHRGRAQGGLGGILDRAVMRDGGRRRCRRRGASWGKPLTVTITVAAVRASRGHVASSLSQGGRLESDFARHEGWVGFCIRCGRVGRIFVRRRRLISKGDVRRSGLPSLTKRSRRLRRRGP